MDTSSALHVETETQITALKARFTELQARTRAEIVSLNKSVRTISVKLSQTLPPRIEKDYRKYVHSKRGGAQNNLDELFEDISEFCQNCFEYELLQYIINTNNSASLKNAMEQYGKDVERFKQHTIAVQYGKLLVKKSVPKGYRKLTTKHAVNPTECTLARIDQFSEDVWNHPHSKLAECSFHLHGIIQGSVTVDWAFPAEFSYTLIAFFCGEDGKEVLQEHQIDMIMIDDAVINQSVILCNFK